MNQVYYNGSFIDSENVCISPNNRAFMYGDGFFEAMRVHKQSVVFWSYHWMRIQKTLDFMKLEFPYSSLELASILAELIERNKIDNGMLRLSICRQAGGKYFPESNESELIIEFKADQKPLYAIDKDKVRLALLYKENRLPVGTMGNYKTVNKSLHVLASIEAQRSGCDEAVLFNTNDTVAEAISSNIYCVFGEEIWTPPLTDGGLNGTLRKVLMANANLLGLRLIERSISETKLLSADEVFTSNAGVGIASIDEFAAQKFKRDRTSDIADVIRELAINSCSGFRENLP